MPAFVEVKPVSTPVVPSRRPAELEVEVSAPDGRKVRIQGAMDLQSLTAVITADAVRALKLRRGDDALAIIKSTEVMIARAGHQEVLPKRRVRK